MIFILFLTAFNLFLGFSLIFPIFPTFVKELNGNPSDVGILISIQPFMQFLFSPLWGALSDKFGPKKFIFIGMLGYAISFYLTAIANNIEFLYFARILGGILSSSAIPTIFSYSSYISNAENRNIYLGIIGGGFGLGLIIGPFIGGILGIFNIRFVFFISFLIFLINALLVLVFLKELKIQTIEKSKSNIRLLNKYILFSLFVNFIVLFWATNMQIVLGILLSYKFHLDVFKIGLIIGIGGIFGAISQLSLKFLLNLFSEKFLIVIGILLLSISMIFVPLINNPSLLFVVMVLYGLGFGILQVNITARASKKIPNEYQGQFMGLFQSSGSFGRFLGPIICSFLYQINPNLPYFLGGFILAITSILLIIWF